MVLLTTIVMIVVLTMLVLTLMQAIFLYIKVNHQVVRKHDALYALETVAYSLMISEKNKECLVHIEDPNQVIEQLSHQLGCVIHDNGREYHYLIDDLGVFPCLQIQLDEKIYSSQQWLISVASSPPQQEIMQLRIAKPVMAIACDQGDALQINRGLMSWRRVEAPHY